MDETTNVIEEAQPSEVSDSETTAAPAFVCDCQDWMLSACAGLPFYNEHEGRRYCVLHYPSKDKSADFKAAVDKKLAAEDFNFRGVWFPDEVSFNGFEFKSDAYFSSATFSADAYFSSATFSADAYFSSATFSAGANFSLATFSADADFSSATFSADAYFSYATFSAGANFSSATFSAGANFSLATFSADADFIEAKFSADAYFSDAIFKDKLSFTGTANNAVFLEGASLDLQHIRVEKPERVSFHTLTLRPHWFINVDARKFEFVNVMWITDDIDHAIERLEAENIEHPHRLLSIACRHLAVNAEEYHRYEDGMRFRYWAMDAKRRERFKGFAFWSLGWWYWALSGYGERVFRAFVALIGIWIVFALLYTQVGFVRWEPRLTSASDLETAERDTIGHPLPLSRAFTYSLAVMSLQKPDPKPATNTAHALVVLHTILGPLQAALLALAIRRRFMR